MDFAPNAIPGGDRMKILLRSDVAAFLEDENYPSKDLESFQKFAVDFGFDSPPDELARIFGDGSFADYK